MPTQSEKAAALLQELLKRRGKLTPPTDRLGMERPILSSDFDNQPMAGWEKAAAILGAAASPVSTITSMALASPPEETLFDRAITGPDGKLEILPETLEGAVPRMKKVQRKAIKTLHKFPTKESYLSGAGNDTYSRSAKSFGVEAPGRIKIAPKDYSGTTHIPEIDSVVEYVEGKPVGSLSFGLKGKVGLAGVLPEMQGKGIGKELYKKAALLGKNVYDLGITSQDAAKARYNALVDLAEGKFPKKPQSIKKLGKPIQRTIDAVDSILSAPEPERPRNVQASPGGWPRSVFAQNSLPVSDFNRMQYLNKVQDLKNAYKSGELTAAGYSRARNLLDNGPYVDVAEHTRRRANIIGGNMSRAILELLDFTPK